MKKEYIWEINVKNTPLLKRKCNHCKCDRFYCSDKFRINSQKKNIDVWLIYKCRKCNNTYNLNILSHTKPEQIKKDLLLKFYKNNKAIAWQHAFSGEIARNNNVELDYKSVKYEIENFDLFIYNILSNNNEIVAFSIKTRFEFGLKLIYVVRLCLGVSLNQLKHMIEAKAIFTSENYNLKKHKIKNGDIILINKEKFRNIYINKLIL